MAKKRDNERPERIRSGRELRESRFASKQAEQLRTLRLVGIGILGLVALIAIIGLIMELVVVPNQTIADVGTESIQMGEWQDRVRFERSQLISQLEQQVELFSDEEAEDQADAEENALRTIQQFAGQQINILFNGHEVIGEQVLEAMIEDQFVRQEATQRGISISQSEVDAAIGERFNYFDGGLPTPFPTATDEPEPTPSITPIPTDVPEGAEIVEEPTPTDGPTSTPFPTSTPGPTNTPVSQAYFDEQLQEELDGIESAGGDPSFYSEAVETGLYREKLAEQLFAESGEPTNVPHTSAFLLVYNSAEDAEAALIDVNSIGFVEVWNQVRSAPPNPENPTPPQALERLWQTEESWAQTYSGDLPGILTALPIGQPTDIIQEIEASTQLPIWVIAQATGREDRELDRFTINRKQQEALQAWVTEQRNDGAKVTVFENWRRRIPRQPGLDRKFVQPVNTPTPPPDIPPTPGG